MRSCQCAVRCCVKVAIADLLRGEHPASPELLVTQTRPRLTSLNFDFAPSSWHSDVQDCSKTIAQSI